MILVCVCFQGEILDETGNLSIPTGNGDNQGEGSGIRSGPVKLAYPHTS